MLHLSKKANELKERVEGGNMEKRSVIWKTASESDCLDDFPILSEAELRNITCGIYQLKMPSSYMQEHIEGNCDIFVHQGDAHLIRAKIQSHHTSLKNINCGFNMTNVIY